MDDGTHRENGRPKPPQGQWFMQHQPSMKQIMGIMAERDAAIQERNLALTEKKSALAERDMAILQRDSAIQERNGAMMDRENAIATLQYRENAINSGMKHMHHHPHQHMHHHQHQHQHQGEESSYNSREMQPQISEALPLSPPPPEPAKPKRAKREKEPKITTPKKPAKKKVRKERDEDYEDGSKHSWKDQNLGLNQVCYDDSTMPVPVCSCTGVYRPCYKWGSGGWQSSCCTTTLSQYPLPQVPNKRHARIGGRKMSGSAFNKLLSRLAAEGHDLSNPVDLKDNWAKHGTNRYITIR